MKNENKKSLRTRILKLVDAYYTSAFPGRKFIPGESAVHIAGRVFNGKEIENLVDASLDFWLTAGRFADRFEKEFSGYAGVKHCSLTNSGSSANLLALTALTSPKLGSRRLKPQDEVITVACSFPTTINPIVQNQLIPVFLDIKIPTYNINTDYLEKALSPKTRAIIIAHTLGNPFDIDAVMLFARKHRLWVIEDCADALGSLYKGKKTGSFGHLSTFSFYPAHHITMGEGGAVLTNDIKLKRIVDSYRDWGRDCYCATGCDNTCKKRFGWKLGDLPYGYDHKYIYSHIGYNLKLTDMQAAVGCAQLDKLPDFTRKRIRNFNYLYKGLKDLEEFLILPEATINSKPSWFGFPVTLREPAPSARNQLVEFLESRKIVTRFLFAGNLVRQPAYKGIKYRKVGNLEDSDRVMRQSFWVGTYPGLTREMINYIISVFQEYFNKR